MWPLPNPGKEGRQRARSAGQAPQFSRGQLIGQGCCRTMGGGPSGLRAWDEPSTVEAIAAKRVHDRPMNRTTCAVQCAALKRCTHFELNMHGQPARSNQGVCSVFASGGYSVTTACKDSSGRPRMHCFAAAKLAWTRAILARTKRTRKAPPGQRLHSSTGISSSKFTIGVVANEFFDLDLGRMGGFGWSTLLLAEVFRRREDLHVQLIFIFADHTQRKASSRRNGGSRGITTVHGWPLIELQSHKKNDAGSAMPWTQRYLQAAQPDVFIFIDFRDSYLRAHTAMPHVPIILWARDPRTKHQAELIQANLACVLCTGVHTCCMCMHMLHVYVHVHVLRTRMIHRALGGCALHIEHSCVGHRWQGIRIPGDSSPPQGRGTPDATGAGGLYRSFTSNLVVGVTWMPALENRLLEAYEIPTSVAASLPNVIRISPVEPKDTGEAPAPLVVFLARLDPYKRPWLLVALARAFPNVNFVVAGQAHFSGKGQCVHSHARPNHPARSSSLSVVSLAPCLSPVLQHYLVSLLFTGTRFHASPTCS